MNSNNNALNFLINIVEYDLFPFVGDIFLFGIYFVRFCQRSKDYNEEISPCNYFLNAIKMPMTAPLFCNGFWTNNSQIIFRNCNGKNSSSSSSFMNSLRAMEKILKVIVISLEKKSFIIVFFSPSSINVFGVPLLVHFKIKEATHNELKMRISWFSYNNSMFSIWFPFKDEVSCEAFQFEIQWICTHVI